MADFMADRNGALVAINWEMCSVATHSAMTNSSAASWRGIQRQAVWKTGAHIRS